MSACFHQIRTFLTHKNIYVRILGQHKVQQTTMVAVMMCYEHPLNGVRRNTRLYSALT